MVDTPFQDYVLNVDHAYRFVVGVDYGEFVDSEFVEDGRGFGGEGVGSYFLAAGGHDVARLEIETVLAVFCQQSPQVGVGDDSRQSAVFAHDHYGSVTLHIVGLFEQLFYRI